MRPTDPMKWTRLAYLKMKSDPKSRCNGRISHTKKSKAAQRANSSEATIPGEKQEGSKIKDAQRKISYNYFFIIFL